MAHHTRIFTVGLLAGVVAVSSALAGRNAQASITSTLDGKHALPLRIPWIATVHAASGVSEVDFFIDGFHAWSARTAPWYYGGDGNSLVTTFLKPGMHKFVVRAIGATGTIATDTVQAQVGAAPRPAAKLAGSWKRGTRTLTISKLGWALGPNQIFDARYLPNSRVALGAAVVDRPEQTAYFCALVDPQHTWTIAIAAGDTTVKLAPLGTDPCQNRVAVLQGTWTRAH